MGAAAPREREAPEGQIDAQFHHGARVAKNKREGKTHGSKEDINDDVGLTEHNTKQQDASEMKMSTWCTWSEVTWQGLENINK